ncbi:MAG: phage adaptor protein [Candidatus Thorarchaeota archaeon]|jgi:hypothetical protein
MTTFQFETSFFTLGDIKRQVRQKIKEDTDVDDIIEDWANIVVQYICTEFPPPSLISDGDDTLTPADAISDQIWALPADLQFVYRIRETTTPWDTLIYKSPSDFHEKFDITTPTITETPDYYTIVGRAPTLAESKLVSAIAPLRIKFDSIPNSTDIFQILYQKLHTKLTDDLQPIYLPPEWHGLVIEGVMLEAAEFTGVNTSDYERKERKWNRRLRRAYKSRNQNPDNLVVMGEDYDLESRSHHPPVFPGNYPR